MINAEQKLELKRCLAGFMVEDEPLAPKSAFKTGGAAAIYLQPENLVELKQAVKTLAQFEVGFLVLGGGSNLLIADTGIRDRAVISLDRGFSHFEIVGADQDAVMIRAAAGVRLADLIQLSMVGGYSGWENLAGIPGTLGGALAMNAGAYGTTIYDSLTAVSVLHGSELNWRPRAKLNPGYRDGGLAENDIAVAAYFHLQRSISGKITEKVSEINRQRRQRLPKGRHAGSVFKNPPADSAGRLLDTAGCKGLRCGGAQVTEQHANVIVADKDATSKDIATLMKKMQTRVQEHHNIVLEPEIKVYL